MVVLGPGMVEFDELAWRLKENDTTYFYMSITVIICYTMKWALLISCVTYALISSYS